MSVSWNKVANVMDLLLRKDIAVHIRMKYCGVPDPQVIIHPLFETCDHISDYNNN